MYTVQDADINGDDIPDIIVKNKASKNVIVNGYTTVDSAYPYRYAYYTEYPTEDLRKEARNEQINIILGIKTKPTLFITIAADVWNQTILIPAMVMKLEMLNNQNGRNNVIVKKLRLLF